MKAPANMLVAIDLYDNYQLLLNRAVQLARTYNAVLNVAYVMSPIITSVPYAYDFQNDMETEAQTKLEKIKNEVSGLTLNTHLLSGTPKNEIVALVDKLGIDLLILGSHGKHGFDLLLGSTASSILHLANCNILTIHIDTEGNPTTTGQYKRILYATDLHDDNKVVADAANTIAKQCAAELYIVHAIPDITLVSGMYTPQLEIDLQSEAKPRMAKLAAEYHISAERTKIIAGHPKSEILNHAAQLNAEMIVIGSHGRKGIASALLGSTANAVLHGAKSDIFVVRIK